MADSSISYRGCHFPGVVIAHAVWLYLRLPLSYLDVEELLAEDERPTSGFAVHEDRIFFFTRQAAYALKCP